MNDKKKAIEITRELYVTASQLRVYLNEGDHKDQKSIDGPKEENFEQYCMNCACYNILCDLQDKHPEDIEFFWHDKLNTFGFVFMGGSIVSDKLEKLGVLDDLTEDVCEVIF